MRKSIFVFAVAGIILPLSVAAQGGTPPSIAEYVATFYRFSLGIAGVLAVAMIVVGSLYYSLSGIAEKKNQGKEFITSAIYGLILLLGAYLILNTINPELTTLKDLSGLTPVTTELFSYQGPVSASANSCGTFSAIAFSPQPSGATLTCASNRIAYDGSSEFDVLDDNKYYDPFLSQTIRPRATIWVYPFYHNDSGTSSARCLIYAYRNPGDDENTTIDLGDVSRCSGRFTSQSSSAVTYKPCSDCLTTAEARIPTKAAVACNQISSSCSLTAPESCVSAPGQYAASSLCQINRDLSFKLLQVVNRGIQWQITEAWPPTLNHRALCHQNGTCVDVGITETVTCDKVATLKANIEARGLCVLNEYPSCEGGVRTERATGGHLHVSNPPCREQRG